MVGVRGCYPRKVFEIVHARLARMSFNSFWGLKVQHAIQDFIKQFFSFPRRINGISAKKNIKKVGLTTENLRSEKIYQQMKLNDLHEVITIGTLTGQLNVNARLVWMGTPSAAYE